MNVSVCDRARLLARQHVDRPCLIFEHLLDTASSNNWREELRHAGVPVLEMNEAPSAIAAIWLDAASVFSAEFMTPVVVFGASNLLDEYEKLDQQHRSAEVCERLVDDRDWLFTRQIALTHAVETSALNQEIRNSHARRGWIRFGWNPESVMTHGNGLLLAWSSPLPLRRIRNFAARYPEVTMIGPNVEAIAAEVAAQGISVKGWLFEVK